MEKSPDPEEWLIDGYNLLHAVLLTPEERTTRWWSSAMRDRVLERVGRAMALHRAESGGDARARVYVVFDGADESLLEPAPPALGTVFARSADDWILKRVRAADAPDRIGVVTADRPVAARAAHRGARVVGPREFLHLETRAAESD